MVYRESTNLHDADAGSSPNQSRLRFKLKNEMRTKLADSIASPLDKYLPIFDPRAKKTLSMALMREMLGLIRSNVPVYSDLEEATLVG